MADTNPALDIKQTHVAATWQHGKPLICCRFDPSGRYLFSCSEDATVQRFDVASGTKTALPKGHETWLRGMTFSHDGASLVTGGYDDTLIWWPVEGPAEKLAPIRKVRAHDGWIRALATSPDGRLLASAGNDLVVRLWNFSDGKLVRELKGHDKHIYSLLFHPSGEFLLSGDLRGQVHQWEVASGKQVATFDAKPLHTYNSGQRVDYGGVRSLALSPDSKQLACSGLHKATNPLGAVNEPLVVVFDFETRKVLKSHVAAGVRGIGWRTVYRDPDLMIGVSGGSGGGFLVFWKPGQDKELHKFKLPNSAREMDLHPDRLRVATAHHDGKVRISLLAKGLRLAGKPSSGAPYESGG